MPPDALQAPPPGQAVPQQCSVPTDLLGTAVRTEQCLREIHQQEKRSCTSSCSLDRYCSEARWQGRQYKARVGSTRVEGDPRVGQGRGKGAQGNTAARFELQ